MVFLVADVGDRNQNKQFEGLTRRSNKNNNSNNTTTDNNNNSQPEG